MKTLFECTSLYLKVLVVLLAVVTVISVISAKPENSVEHQF